MPTKNYNKKYTTEDNVAIRRLTAAALVLPGLLAAPSADAAEDDEIDFQYSHYSESERSILGIDLNPSTGNLFLIKLPDQYHPIVADSLRGTAKISLSDRVKFAFNYTQDTWSGATPITTAPAAANVVRPMPSSDGSKLIGGATPYLQDHDGYFDAQANPVYLSGYDSSFQPTYQRDNRLTHVMSFASPETRKQGDFKLRYQWDETAIEGGGGLSVENDYESRFVNLGGSLDFNQKQTRLTGGLSYTNSRISAQLDPVPGPYVGFTNYLPADQSNDFGKSLVTGKVKGTRQDWSTQVQLTQVLNRDAEVMLGMDYTRSSGFLENPYKTVLFYDTKNGYEVAPGVFQALKQNWVEQRPDIRNLWSWQGRYNQYLGWFDASLQLGYRFAVDNWGISSHTFDVSWGQPLGAGWTITPHARYYSQEAANFYHPYLLNAPNGIEMPDKSAVFSSDHRLSGFGALSGGITLSKQFAKGVSLEAGFDYYSHAGSLKLGGGGEASYADFNYFSANAALKLNLDALGRHWESGSRITEHRHVHNDPVPAGVLFGHMLPEAGSFMAGYRYMHSRQSGAMLNGDSVAAVTEVIDHGCGKLTCMHWPLSMDMSMHMLDLMYAPTDWLSLMLMPQFVDMEMNTQMGEDSNRHLHVGAAPHSHATGGVGDTGLYALFKLWETPVHHVHATMGLSAPTGAVDLFIRKGGHNEIPRPMHFGMQLGSGTWDVKPSLTYTGRSDDWNWGGQLAGTWRPQGHNAGGYALGNLFQGSVWGGYRLNRWLNASLRAQYAWEDKIRGDYPRYHFQCNRELFVTPNGVDEASYQNCQTNIAPKIEERRNNLLHQATFDMPGNYGGHYVDVGFGLNLTVPDGAFAGHSLKFEWLQPVYTHVNGYQLDRSGALSFTWAYGF